MLEGMAIIFFYIFLWFVVIILIPISVYSLVKVMLGK